jgi:hypothetical protein
VGWITLFICRFTDGFKSALIPDLKEATADNRKTVNTIKALFHMMLILYVQKVLWKFLNVNICGAP